MIVRPQRNATLARLHETAKFV
ncbi:hypothetical protein AGR8A_Cc70420 [Agrobacterium fabrum str. J-07]|nr:hypothetical protein AGR8A_Cc70420 [Agrobacterium fabrum str. J-07]